MHLRLYKMFCGKKKTFYYFFVSVLTQGYDPTTGRFINADGLFDNRDLNTINLFQYCGNSPVNNADPNGKLFFAIVGVVLLVVGAVALLSGCSSKPVAAPSSSPTTTRTTSPSTKAPTTPSTTPSTTKPSLPQIKTGMPKKDYVNAVHARAKADQQKTKIPAGIMTAQCCMESKYGTSDIAINKNNLFGLRDSKGVFMSFDNIDDSITCYENSITKNQRYQGLFKLNTAKELAYAIGPAGYCPDKGYGDLLWGVIQSWDLE